MEIVDAASILRQQSLQQIMGSIGRYFFADQPQTL
jgi:hypothetical protein